jgi:DUF4097 and DUF4098 domain-containing protein YvlB
MRKSIPLIMMICSINIAVAQEKPQETFNVSPGQKVSFKLQTGGSIQVTGWGQSVLALDYDVRDREAGDVRIETKQTSQGVVISTKYTRSHHQNSSGMHFIVKAPRKFDIDIDTMGGAVTISDIEGKIKGRTMGGALSLSGLKGEVDLTTMGGPITLTKSEVDGKLHTMGGKVLFQDVTGDVIGSSMGGNVVYRNVRILEKSASGRVENLTRSVGKEVNINTMGGEIRVEDAPLGANVSTMGGNIHIKNARQFVKARTMGGEIAILAVDGSVDATTMGGNVEVHVVGTGDDLKRDVTISSMGGEITLYVPDKLSMAFDIKLAFTKDSRKDFKIANDFGIQVTGSDDWDYSKGSPRKYYRGTGTYLGGKNRIKIETINGNINIRRAN